MDCLQGINRKAKISNRMEMVQLVDVLSPSIFRSDENANKCCYIQRFGISVTSLDRPRKQLEHAFNNPCNASPDSRSLLQQIETKCNLQLDGSIHEKVPRILLLLCHNFRLVHASFRGKHRPLDRVDTRFYDLLVGH